MYSFLIILTLLLGFLNEGTVNVTSSPDSEECSELYTMQSDELAHLSKVYSVIAVACIPISHCILNKTA